MFSLREQETFLFGETASRDGHQGVVLCHAEHLLRLQVLADDVDIRELDAQWFRSQLGVVSQEPSLFSDSVAANICYGLPGTTRVRLCWRAQRKLAIRQSIWLAHRCCEVDPTSQVDLCFIYRAVDIVLWHKVTAGAWRVPCLHAPGYQEYLAPAHGTTHAM